MKILIIPIYVLLSVSGLILMKLGGNTGTLAIKDNNISLAMNMISALGFVCYIGSFLLFTRIVIMFDVSYIFPICTGIVQVIALIGCALVLKEKITIESIIGTALIIGGILVMNFKKGN